jgi:hypothetical protein
MDKFNKALDEVISAWIKLSDEWEKIELTHSDKLAEGYPFNKDFGESNIRFIGMERKD